MSDDPWDCFGGSESDEDSEEDKIKEETRLRLITKANLGLQREKNSSSKEGIVEDEVFDRIPVVKHDDVEVEVELPPTIDNMWSNHLPLYMGPMAVVEEANCNRGYIATEDLKPGTLLLVEEPVFKWPEEQIGSELGLSSIQAIMDDQLAQDIIVDIELLYPTKSEVDTLCRSNSNIKNQVQVDVGSNEKIQIKDMIEIMQMQHSEGKELKRVLESAKGITITDSSTVGGNSSRAIDEIDVMRMLLALRYNGFDSGLYLHFAMFNHNDDANCIKYLPEENKSSSALYNGEHRKIYSEVRTTKFVKRGESLTLHYLNPREVSHATRRQHIWEQHRFDIGLDMSMHNSQLMEMEMVNNEFPSSFKEKQVHERITFFVENAINDLEGLHKELDLASRFLSHQEIEEGLIELFERCKALEMATDEMIQATCTKLENKKHILLIRCCRLHLDSSELLLRFGVEGPSSSSLSLTNRQQLEIMCRFVRTCHTLLPIQIQYLGEHHPDIARTNYDFAMGINSLLSKAPRKIFDMGLSNLSTFNSCQRFEAECRKVHQRIDSLYPRDVEEKILQNEKLK